MNNPWEEAVTAIHAANEPLRLVRRGGELLRSTVVYEILDIDHQFGGETSQMTRSVGLQPRSLRDISNACVTYGSGTKQGDNRHFTIFDFDTKVVVTYRLSLAGTVTVTGNERSGTVGVALGLPGNAIATVTYQLSWDRELRKIKVSDHRIDRAVLSQSGDLISLLDLVDTTVFDGEWLRQIAEENPELAKDLDEALQSYRALGQVRQKLAKGAYWPRQTK